MAGTHATWTWRAETAAGAALDPDPAVPTFGNQSDAETWLGENWPELADQGAEQVILLRDDSVVYGPMSLSTG